MLQKGRSSAAELFVAPGSQRAYSDSFRLLGDSDITGLAIYATGVESEITDLSGQMQGVGTSAFLRLPFDADDTDSFESLILKMQYADGFVAYINGVQVASADAPQTVAWDSVATADRTTEQALSTAVFDVGNHLDAVRDGLNILAIHALSSSMDDDTFLVIPELFAGGLMANEPVFFGVPTPGEVNSSEFLGFVGDTTFSVDRGFFDAPFQLEISTKTDGATIRFTTDGSLPTARQGTVYAGPIIIANTTMLRAAAFKPGFRATNIDAQTYIFAQDVLRQDIANLPADYPMTWQANAAGDYGMDPEIAVEVGNALYQPTLADDLQSIPTMSIVMDHEDLWDSATGIYPNSNTRGESWRRPASVEYFDPNTGAEFQIDAGIQIHGGASRDNVRLLKHSFRLLFREDFGPNELNFPLFSDSDVDNINTLVLRAFFTDAFGTRTASGTVFGSRFSVLA